MTEQAAERRTTFYARYERVLLGSLAVAMVLVAWEVFGRSRVVNPILMSYPTAIVRAGTRMAASGELAEHVLVSGGEFFLGFLLAALTAVPLGLLAGWYGRLHSLLDPFLSALYAVPRVALLPLIVLWAGIGLWSKVLVIFLGAFFPICLNAIAGVRTVDQTHVKLARSFLSSELQIFRTIVVPSCVPFILAGLRLGVGRALVGVVVGELYGASAGVGFLIAMAGNTFQTDKVFVGIALIGAFGLLCNELLEWAERRVERWRPRASAAS